MHFAWSGVRPGSGFASSFFSVFSLSFLCAKARFVVARFRYQFRKIEINKLQLKDLEETTLI
jgi:hypothetical protein